MRKPPVLPTIADFLSVPGLRMPAGHVGEIGDLGMVATAGLPSGNCETIAPTHGMPSGAVFYMNIPKLP